LFAKKPKVNLSNGIEGISFNKPLLSRVDREIWMILQLEPTNQEPPRYEKAAKRPAKHMVNSLADPADSCSHPLALSTTSLSAIPSVYAASDA
jgi:hypothetical protein